MGNMFQQSGGFLNIHDCFIEGGSGGGMYLGNKIDDNFVVPGKRIYIPKN